MTSFPQRVRSWCVPILALLAAGCESEAPPKPVTPAPTAQVPATQAPSAPAPSAPADSTPAREPGAVTAAKPDTPKPEAATTAPKMAPTPGTVLRETELKDKPYVDARTLRKLTPETGLVIIDRQAGWLNVSVSGEQGWVRLLHVSSAPAGNAGTEEELESLARIATGRAGTGNVVATTGIRGLDEEQLKTAKPNRAELEKLERYGVTKEQAAEYARRHKLEARKVAHLAAPK